MDEEKKMQNIFVKLTQVMFGVYIERKWSA